MCAWASGTAQPALRETLPQSFIGTKEKGLIFDIGPPAVGRTDTLKRRDWRLGKIKVILGVQRTVSQEFKRRTVKLLVPDRVTDIYYTSDIGGQLGIIICGNNVKFLDGVNSQIGSRLRFRE